MLDGIGVVVYRIELPVRMARTHNIFHVSHLRKYVNDPSLLGSTVYLDLIVELVLCVV